MKRAEEAGGNVWTGFEMGINRVCVCDRTLHSFQHHIGVIAAPEELVLADGRVEAGQAEVALVRHETGADARTGCGASLAGQFVAHSVAAVFMAVMCRCAVL